MGLFGVSEILHFEVPQSVRILRVGVRTKNLSCLTPSNTLARFPDWPRYSLNTLYGVLRIVEGCWHLMPGRALPKYRRVRLSIIRACLANARIPSVPDSPNRPHPGCLKFKQTKNPNTLKAQTPSAERPPTGFGCATNSSKSSTC